LELGKTEGKNLFKNSFPLKRNNKELMEKSLGTQVGPQPQTNNREGNNKEIRS